MDVPGESSLLQMMYYTSHPAHSAGQIQFIANSTLLYLLDSFTFEKCFNLQR